MGNRRPFRLDDYLMDQPPRASSYDYEAPQGDPWDASNEPDAHSPLMMIQPDAEDVSAEDNADLDGWIDATALDEPMLTRRDGESAGIGPYDDQEPMLPQRGRSPDQTKMSQEEDDLIEISEAEWARTHPIRGRDASHIAPLRDRVVDASKIAPMREGDFDGSKISPRAEASFDGRGIEPLFDADMEFTQDEADSAMRESFGGVESLADQLIAEAHAKRQRSGMRR
jgi:hypothetical protein